VEGHAVRTRLDEVLNVALGLLDHEVDVEHGGRWERLAQRGDDHRAEGDRRDEVPVHDVAVDEPRAGGHDLLDLRREPGEVRAEDAGGHPDQTGHSIEAPQLTQVMLAVEDMRTMVECSLQSGQTERSS
jgi:hypothetical protein